VIRSLSSEYWGITVVWTEEIDTLSIKKMVLEEKAGDGGELKGEGV
jgi:hypothetical protein